MECLKTSVKRSPGCAEVRDSGHIGTSWSQRGTSETPLADMCPECGAERWAGAECSGCEDVTP